MSALPQSSWARSLAALAAAGLMAGALLAVATHGALRDFPGGLEVARSGAVRPVVLARDGSRLAVSLENAWNVADVVPLPSVPAFLQRAFVLSEDQHFYGHEGVDWPARLAALGTDLEHGASVRGASTITEQVVRMLHPRPRTLWSRWLEGFEAGRLEARYGKEQILAFYLNQVPYGARRRGVLQAAHYYYGRDLSTLTRAEMLTLVVLVRSPAGMDPQRNLDRARRAVTELADRLVATGALTADERRDLRVPVPDATAAAAGADAAHFVAHVLGHYPAAPTGELATTLDPYLQSSVQRTLDVALAGLVKWHVHEGAVLVIDHERNEILAWVVGHPGGAAAADSGLGYDTVLLPRQPGSTMKPLLYALALERGWTAATLIDDSELSEGVGGGLHTFRNYSRVHYGPIRLREALGNSLNVPAVKTLRFVGCGAFLARLHALGVVSLAQHPDYYGDGLALGNGEVSLYEMAQAYTALARRGRYLPLTAVPRGAAGAADVPVISPEAASLIANILADPGARAREFGPGLRFAVETAIKTGTSSDYRDAWAIGFDYAHTVAVWMGNLDEAPMDGVTGAAGPAQVLRSVFAQLNAGADTRPLWLSAKLVAADICRDSGRPADGGCSSTPEWFLPDTLPQVRPAPPAPPEFRLSAPTPGLQVARDPRIPQELQALPMSVAGVPELREVAWYVDDRVVARTADAHYAWPLAPGVHEAYAQIAGAADATPQRTARVRFYVR
ncbi:MAG TPA: transglycosylase domain-containing protein [Steroidobacteraceae bacterium]|jgi:penicillin-binding protein 1C|nr:transglycosylase domain-containing protein [Steroidobacteraceae bacterium]